MAGLDYGVITIKNKKLLKDDKSPLMQGEGGYFCIGNAIFDRINPTIQVNPSDNTWDDYIHFLNIGGLMKFKTFSMYDEFIEKKKKVFYWRFTFQNKFIEVKTKEIIGLQIFTSSFRIENDNYFIIHGYDVSLNNFHHRSSKKHVHSLIKKNTN